MAAKSACGCLTATAASADQNPTKRKFSLFSPYCHKGPTAAEAGKTANFGNPAKWVCYNGAAMKQKHYTRDRYEVQTQDVKTADPTKWWVLARSATTLEEARKQRDKHAADQKALRWVIDTGRARYRIVHVVATCEVVE